MIAYPCIGSDSTAARINASRCPGSASGFT